MNDNYFEELKARFDSMSIDEIKREYEILHSYRKSILDRPNEELTSDEYTELDKIEETYDFLAHFLACVYCSILCNND